MQQSQQVRKLRVAILIPSADTWKAKTSISVAGLTGFSMTHGVEITIIGLESSMITSARNTLVQDALDYGADYALWIDSDMQFPMDALKQLLAHDKDIVGCMYNQRAAPYKQLGKLAGPAVDISSGGLREAEYLPGGFMLVKTAVYKKLPYPWYFEVCRRPGNALESFIARLSDDAVIPMPSNIATKIMHNSEVRKWIEKNHATDLKLHEDSIMGEDYSACKKMRRYGFKIYCDLDLTWRLAHLGQVAVTIPTPCPKT